MVKDSVPRTPTRRSKRGQPIITSKRASPSDSGGFVWLSAVLHSRRATPDDLYEEEWDEDPETNISFYESFKRKKRDARSYGRISQRKSKIKSDAEGEVFAVGDTVLIRTGAPLPSIGVITSMWEVADEDDEDADRKARVKVHWFLRPTEMASVRAKRDHIENEIYYSITNTAVIAPPDILSSCIVSASAPLRAESKSTLAWSVSPTKPKPRRAAPRKSLDDTNDEKEQFYCHLAVDSRRGLFYNFEWEAHRMDALADKAKEWMSGTETIDERPWDVAVLEEFKKARDNRGMRPSPRKKRKLSKDDSEESEGSSGDDFEAPNEDEEDEDEERLHALEHSDSEPEDDDDDDDDMPKTPSKTRKHTRSTTAVPTTPSKRTPSKQKPSDQTRTPRRQRVLAAPTPHSKAALRSRKIKQAVRPPPPQFASALQSANLPRDPWLRAMHVLHVGARPDALPCRDEEYGRILRSVEELLEEGSGGCIYISGVPGTGKTATVHTIVRELKRMAKQGEANPFTYVEINGLKIPEPSAAYSLLWEAVSGHDAAREGHMKVSAKEALKQLTRHFSGGARAGPGGHACVVLMDELDQLVTAKQDVVYNFFNWPTLAGSKLVVLAVANTMDLPERVMTGRVRSRLGMIRINFQPYTTLQLEKIVHARLSSAREGLSKIDKATKKDVIAPDGVKFAAMKVSSISGDARRVLDICRRAVELVQPSKSTARTEDVKEVIKIMQNSPTAAFLRDCSLHERLMLAALVKCVKREGVEEIRWSEVQYQHLTYMNVLAELPDLAHKPSPAELGIVLDTLVASRALLFEDGLASSRKMEGERRVMLNLEQGEVERVLGEVGGQRWKNVLSV